MARWRRKKHVELRSLVTALLMGTPNAPLWVAPVWVLGGVLIDRLNAKYGPLGLLFPGGLVFIVKLVEWWRERRTELVPVLEEKRPPGAYGLILPLSTIAPIGGNQEQRAALAALLSKFQQANSNELGPDDFAHLERTNLDVPLTAIEFHYSKGCLRDCWLITTQDVTYPDGKVERGSRDAGPVLERWFFHRHPEARATVKFYYQDASLCVHPRNYAQIWLLVDDLFEKAPCKAENLLVDITPGTKPMTLAIALACLEPKRRMEYIATRRDPLTGEVLEAGKGTPILIDVAPYLYEEVGAAED